MFTLPINIKTKQVTKRRAAVEKLAGNINPQTINTGNRSGTKADLKLFISSCFFDNKRAKYMIKVSLAKSEVWKDKLKGKGRTLLASFRFNPINKVSTSKGTAMYNAIWKMRE